MLITQRGSRKSKGVRRLRRSYVIIKQKAGKKRKLAKQAELHETTMLCGYYVEILQWGLHGETTAPEHNVKD